MKIDLRGYQLEAFDAVRAAIREGARSVLVNAPTGSGKTVLASALMEMTKERGNRANFVVDRLSLVQQTSDTFDRYGLDHGVIQGDHPRYRPSLPLQLCSVQTLAKRGWPEAHVDVIDECHVLHSTVKKRIESRETIVIGLTATPFTKGLGKFFQACVNVTTTNALIGDGWLAPYRAFSCTQPDMSGVALNSMGEFNEQESSKAALQVVGDVVAEYLKNGEGRKFICSGVDTAHVEALAAQFIAAGIPVASYTYKDDVEDRADTTIEFRKPNSTIRGLITVTAASRGFDIPDIGCVIEARPLRKGLADHIQLLGRGLRIADGKTDCIVLDHSGNVARFWHRREKFFAEGIERLDDGKPKEKKKAEEKEVEPVMCPQCRAMHNPAPFCPVCGHEYPKRAAVQHVPGTLTEIMACGDAQVQRSKLWPMVCGYVLERDSGNLAMAQKRAQGIFKGLTGEFCRARIETTTPAPPTRELRNRILADRIKWAKGREKAAQQQGATA